MVVAITNRKGIKSKEFYDVIKDLVEAGVDMIILREKDLSVDEITAMAGNIKEIIGANKTLLVVNGCLEAAKNVKASGYHMSTYEFVHKGNPGFGGLLGVSVHTIEEAIQAENSGASYVLASHIFKTSCKEDLSPKGLRFIEEMRRRIKIPIIALGGINLSNIKEVIKAGADGVAVMSAFMSAENTLDVARDFVSKANDAKT